VSAADAVEETVRRGDLDELLRLIEQLCDARQWDSLTELRASCERAHETGRQLWPAAAHASYRLALEAPAELAAAVLVDDALPFALGPLPEVAAQHHSWAELEPHLSPGVAAVLTAHERVLRGEDLDGIELPGPAALELPLRLAPWEPQYSLAEYHADHADFPAPPLPSTQPAALPSAPAQATRDEACAALVDLVRTWTTRSDGRADAVVVGGDALSAIAALGPTAVRVGEIAPVHAMALMAWAGASGGAHGPRPGAASGRFGAWWAMAAITDLLDPWPPEPDALGAALDQLRCTTWDAAEPATGWRLQLAIEAPDKGRAWAVAAIDAA